MRLHRFIVQLGFAIFAILIVAFLVSVWARKLFTFYLTRLIHRMEKVPKEQVAGLTDTLSIAKSELEKSVEDLLKARDVCQRGRFRD